MKNKMKPIIFGSLSALWTYIIISMSMQNAETSNGVSRGLLKALLITFYEITNIEISPDTIHTLFRKMAHFTEFFVLGIFVVLFFDSIKKNKLLAVLYGAAIAYFDELTQFFTGEGRAMQFSDMIIDTSGAALAVFIICLCQAYKLNKVNRQKNT